MGAIAQLELRSLILHQLPNARLRAPAVIADIETTLTDDVRRFFEDRVRTALLESGHPVKFIKPDGVEADASSVQSNLPRMLGTDDGNEFAILTQTVARRLCDEHRSNHSQGLLCFCQFAYESERGVAILKLEHESGVRAHQTVVNGQISFSIDTIDDLLLTQKTRLFKVGFFGSDSIMLACDPQAKKATDVASYFLATYLGCELAESPQVTTRRFYEKTEEFINTSGLTSSERADLTIALLSEINRHSPQIDARQFAKDHLSKDARRTYVKLLVDHDLHRAFPKDMTAVRSRTERLRFSWKKDTIVITTPAQLESGAVQLQDDVENTSDSILTVRGQLEEVSGAR